MLELRDITAAYGNVKTLFGVSLNAAAGQVHCIMGRNGAGKTTTLKTIMGLLTPTGGSITLNGANIGSDSAENTAKRGVGYVPQGRRLFAELSVAENIQIGLMARQPDPTTRDWVLDLFPPLKSRLTQRAETLSGGEQQMLAMARALCLRPTVLLLDEPTEGLQPSMIAQIRNVVIRMRDESVAVVLVEQRSDAVLSMADHVTFLENGRSVETLDIAALKAAPQKLTQYLGV
ncbi:MAG: ATP-binding cassette domain-containing protein [Rhodobacteraceae bacterium]|nr:ATP-binding cassette domain-containing protein [Paracoccaceae bacterium]